MGSPLHAHLFFKWHKTTTLDDDDVIQHEGSVAKAMQLRTTHTKPEAKVARSEAVLQLKEFWTVGRQGTLVWIGI
jgi:hypothetical protein